MSEPCDRPVSLPAVPLEEFRADVARRKRERWAKIVASEPPGRPAGRRPRDPEQEAMLLKLDRARLQRRGFVGK
ncbi:MAG TPA: hypothetical protein VNB06_14845 [Thermoanaerobaculia bacterium]|nr:hypothetical protein [Thermoanaerobaculia bacterium]